MRNRLWFTVFCWSCIAACALDAGLADDGPSPATFSVHLASGRSFTAALDARTDSGQLWLRFHDAGAEVLRPIDWDRVISADVAGQKLSGDEFHGLVEQLRQEMPAEPAPSAPVARIEMIGTPAEEKGTVPICAKHPPGRSGKWGLSPFPPLAETRPVVSLAIDATVGRWDENVDPDGLVVHVYPLDADGAIVPVHGTLNADLKVEQRSIDLLRQPFVDAGQWTEAVHPGDFGPRGAVYRLRFQHIDPEFEDGVRSPGLVHACLAVPGQGTFEASTYLSSIRPFNPVRNELQALTRHGYFNGYRYFSNERTDDGRR